MSNYIAILGTQNFHDQWGVSSNNKLVEESGAKTCGQTK